METHDEYTLVKVRDALVSVGLAEQTVMNAINEMLNRGILFRENREDPQEDLVDHAVRELTILNEEPETIEAIVKVVRAYLAAGLIPGMNSVPINMLYELLQHKNVSELTDRPEEWIEIDRRGGERSWSNIRRPEAISNDGGKTYFLLHETEGTPHRYMYDSKPVA